MTKNGTSLLSIDYVLDLIPRKEIGIEVDSPVLGTKSRISTISIFKHPLYRVKEYLDNARDLQGIEGEEAARSAYELEKAVLSSIPKNTKKTIDGRTVQVFPILSNHKDEEKCLLLEHIPYPSLTEKMETAKNDAERYPWLDVTLSTWMFLCDKLGKYKDAIEVKLGHPLKRVNPQEEFEKFTIYTNLIFGKGNISYDKIKDSFNGLFKRALKNTTIIHGSYYSDHVRLNGERSVNIDAGGIRIGPPEMDIGYMLSDITHFFNDIQVPIKHIIGEYSTKVGEFTEIPKELSEESIALFILLGSLKKAAGIKLRKNQKEMPIAKNLIDNIDRIMVFGSEDLSILTKVLQEARD